MPGLLKQSTASQVVELGPFLDDTDFKTAETALTIANTDIKLRKAGGTTHGSKNSGGGTHIANGYYYATLDATDSNTVGLLDIHVNVSGALPVWDRYYVLEEAIYDALFAASAAGFDASQRVTVGTMASATIAAATFAADTGYSIRKNTATAGGATSITLDASASSTDDFYNNALLEIVSGTGAGQARFVTDYVGSTKVATVRTWVTNPDNTSVFQIFPSDVVLGTDPPTAAAIADAVFDETASDHSTAGTTGKKLIDAASAGDPWSTALPGSYGAGTAGKIVGDNVNATISSRAIAGDAMTLTSGERTASADVLLNRDMSAVTVTNSRSPIMAFRFNRNKFTIDHGTGALTVYKEDDTTVAWTGTISPTASIVTLNVDPA